MIRVRLLHQLSTQAAAEVGLDAAEVSKQIAKREDLGSTGVGNGVALPHAGLKGLKSPFGFFARRCHGIDFEAIDDQPVDMSSCFCCWTHLTRRNSMCSLAPRARSERVRAATDRDAFFRAVADTRGV